MNFINKSYWAQLMAALTLTLATTACEKAVFDEEQTTTTAQSKNANLVIRVKGQQVNTNYSTRAMVNVTDYCTRFNFVIYKNGEKLKALTQQKGDADYGQVALTLEPDTYKVLVLAHNSSGNPSLSNPEEIKFTNDIGYSDTFYYYGDIVVTGKPATHDIVLTRATSRFTFVINDEIPANVQYIKLYYTGGSGVLNATTGYGGSVNSKQTRMLDVSGLQSPVKLPGYTFWQSDSGTLQLTVTAYEADRQTIVKERSFTDIDMERQKETILEGDFFDHESEQTFSFQIDSDWPEYKRIKY